MHDYVIVNAVAGRDLRARSSSSRVLEKERVGQGGGLLGAEAGGPRDAHGDPAAAPRRAPGPAMGDVEGVRGRADDRGETELHAPVYRLPPAGNPRLLDTFHRGPPPP